MKKLPIVVFACLLALPCKAQVTDSFGGVLPVTDSSMKMSLNGEWNLKVVDGISTDQMVPPVDDTWKQIPVPGCWEVYGFCEPTYGKPDSLTGFYRTSFSIPEEWAGKRIILQFDGVLYGYDLWVNDKKAGSWRSGYNTALFDITEHLRKPRTGAGVRQWQKTKQSLAVRVITQFPGSEFDCNDDWSPCGIFRDVTLMAVPDIHVQDLTIRTNLNGDVEVETLVSGGGKKTSVKHEIFDARGCLVGEKKVNNPHLWTAETPYLYTLRTTLSHKGKVLQKFDHKFGFRQLTIEGNILKLNGQPIKLRGVTSHATDPKTVKVISDELTLRDMKLMKEASVNYIRTSHYPREPRFYDLADSLGFYIIDEIPFGYGDKHLSDSTFYPMLQQRALATIRRDKNHASVLIWSLGNENPLTDICVRLGQFVKDELDDTRPICYPQVGSYFRRLNFNLPPVADIYAPHYPTTSQIAGFYQHADRPVIFTEYCHTLGISFEDHDRQWALIEQTPSIAGGSVWEWADQGMPFFLSSKKDIEKGKNDKKKAYPYGYEERVFTSESSGFEMHGDKGTDGLLYADRTPLPNYFELQANYSQAFVDDSVLMAKDGTVEMHIVNRHDFLNLKDNITFRWFLTEDRDTVARGAFSPDCPPHQTVPYTLVLPSALRTSRICLLNIEVSDSHGIVSRRQNIPINPSDLTSRLLEGLDVATGSPLSVLQDSLLIRLGRKPTLAETLTVGEKRCSRYLVPLRADGTVRAPLSVDVRQDRVGNASHFHIFVSPDSTDIFLPEVGIAFLLDKTIRFVQWIGNGPMPSYPGRCRAGRYGFWALRQGDLYLEGNRQGVDAALLTDSVGNGLLLFCRQGNVNFEQTDKGMVLTYNVAVAGQGPKFARTAFPSFTKKKTAAGGDFYLYKVEADRVPPLLQRLFVSPAAIPEPFHPFETQYDTYLNRYEDIVDR